MLKVAASLQDGYNPVSSGKIASVVTSLEMLGPQSKFAVPPHNHWNIQHVVTPDLDWYRDIYRRVGENWLWFSRLRMTDKNLSAVIHDPKVEIYTLKTQDGDEGLLELDFRQEGECELVFFGLVPKLIGCGAGRWLMDYALHLAWSHSIRRFWLHSCSLDHYASIGFYERSGFKPYGRQIEIADDPRLDGTLPRSAAPHIPIL